MTRSISIGELVQDSRDVPGEVDVFAFEATAGQRISFVVQQNLPFSSWSLTDPQGGEVFDAAFANRDIEVLTMDGTYQLTVTVPNDSTGPISFQLWDVPDDTVRPITFGSEIVDSIAIPGQQRFYTFTGVEGRSIYTDVRSNSNPFMELRLTAPSGTVVFDHGLHDHGETTLDETGTYTYTVYDAGISGTADYEFVVYDSTDIGPVPLDLNQGCGWISLSTARNSLFPANHCRPGGRVSMCNNRSAIHLAISLSLSCAIRTVVGSLLRGRIMLRYHLPNLAHTNLLCGEILRTRLCPLASSDFGSRMFRKRFPTML